MWKEFKQFAMQGNVMDLAVAVIIGAAFNQIITSLVNDLIMPAFDVLLGGLKIADLAYPVGETAIRYGSFLQSFVDFFIISFAIFMFIRLITRFRKKEAVAEEAAPAPTAEELLLTEIRDLLKDGAAPAAAEIVE